MSRIVFFLSRLENRRNRAKATSIYLHRLERIDEQYFFPAIGNASDENYFIFLLFCLVSKTKTRTDNSKTKQTNETNHCDNDLLKSKFLCFSYTNQYLFCGIWTTMMNTKYFIESSHYFASYHFVCIDLK